MPLCVTRERDQHRERGDHRPARRPHGFSGFFFSGSERPWGWNSAADNLWRETGNLLRAQQLLRRESVATTQDYLHPSRDDLTNALARLQVVNLDPHNGAAS